MAAEKRRFQTRWRRPFLIAKPGPHQPLWNPPLSRLCAVRATGTEKSSCTSRPTTCPQGYGRAPIAEVFEVSKEHPLFR